MAVFHLELEIDSAAHPELYLMVEAIDNPSFRAERMRQLASTGLIWERMRLAPESALEGPSKTEGSVAVAHLALVTASRPPKQDDLGLPVLRDEVPSSQLPWKSDAVRPARPEAPQVAEPLKPKAAWVAVEAAIDTGPSVHMSGKRSRLMRMKNRGLFTNE
jgi:hypothetical protein